MDSMCTVKMACAALGMYLVRLRLRAFCSRAARALVIFTLSWTADRHTKKLQSPSKIIEHNLVSLQNCDRAYSVA